MCLISDEKEFLILVVVLGPRSIFVIFSFLYSLKEGGQTDYPVIIFVVSQMGEVKIEKGSFLLFHRGWAQCTGGTNTGVRTVEHTVVHSHTKAYIQSHTGLHSHKLSYTVIHSGVNNLLFSIFGGFGKFKRCQNHLEIFPCCPFIFYDANRI